MCFYGDAHKFMTCSKYGDGEFYINAALWAVCHRKLTTLCDSSFFSLIDSPGPRLRAPDSDASYFLLGSLVIKQERSRRWVLSSLKMCQRRRLLQFFSLCWHQDPCTALELKSHTYIKRPCIFSSLSFNLLEMRYNCAKARSKSCDAIIVACWSLL